MNTDASKPRVVVGVDGSPSSHAALRWAVRQACLVGGTVDAVAAWELPGMFGWSGPAVDAEFDEENARQALAQELREVLGTEAPAPVRALVVRGNPVDVLLRAAEGAEALVVGSRGRGGFARALLGSVSHHVALHADCPVVIVRPQTG
ncbi:universal stress protein UspA [Streptomyces hygroscopicus]|uniref:universal stress protein n=1 Tax=Streptomyces hygroscopicus TaxID=1912 RepID=UPI00223EBFD0|nr:universal stress protein [Streptomyces hygroscopicus]MCW7945101.1 universal stress protein UspA [Streptomyces hygroscopicus]